MCYHIDAFHVYFKVIGDVEVDVAEEVADDVTVKVADDWGLSLTSPGGESNRGSRRRSGVIEGPTASVECV